MVCVLSGCGGDNGEDSDGSNGAPNDTQYWPAVAARTATSISLRAGDSGMIAMEYSIPPFISVLPGWGGYPNPYDWIDLGPTKNLSLVSSAFGPQGEVLPSPFRPATVPVGDWRRLNLRLSADNRYQFELTSPINAGAKFATCSLPTGANPLQAVCSGVELNLTEVTARTMTFAYVLPEGTAPGLGYNIAVWTAAGPSLVLYAFIDTNQRSGTRVIDLAFEGRQDYIAAVRIPVGSSSDDYAAASTIRFSVHK